MKKQLLFLPLVGLLCFTSCNKSRELTPVDDITGLDRATSVYGKDAMAYKQLTTNNPLAIFDILPHKFSFEIKTVENGKYRTLDNTLIPYNIVEVTKNNLVTYERRCEINYDTLQAHEYYYDNTVLKTLTENYFFYDEAKSECYLLQEAFGARSVTVTPVANKEEATAQFGEALKNIFSKAIYFIIPYDYLMKLTAKSGEDYILLQTYQDVDEFFEEYGNGGEYLKHRFGSDDENSFSLKNDFKDAARYIPTATTMSLLSDGYVEGMETIKYNQMIAQAHIEIPGFGAPDLVVFKDNYLNYAHLVEKIDANSLAQLGCDPGAFYQHTTKESTIEVTKDKADITNPDPNDYR